jgi:hypothetical protein
MKRTKKDRVHVLLPVPLMALVKKEADRQQLSVSELLTYIVTNFYAERDDMK